MIYRYFHVRNRSLTESIFLHGPDNKILNLLISASWDRFSNPYRALLPPAVMVP